MPYANPRADISWSSSKSEGPIALPSWRPRRSSVWPIGCQQVVNSDPTRSLASHHGALPRNLAEQG
jgi:hypothetical protein